MRVNIEGGGGGRRSYLLIHVVVPAALNLEQLYLVLVTDLVHGGPQRSSFENVVPAGRLLQHGVPTAALDVGHKNDGVKGQRDLVMVGVDK